MICSLEVPTYSSLVMEFFENIRMGTGSLEYCFKGVLIVISERRLGQILQMSRAHICIAKLTDKIEGL